MTAALCLVFVCELVLFAWFENTNLDEGWYLLAGRLVYDGQVPYHDFPYFQGPLLPYIVGLPQTLFVQGILTGRIFAALLGGASALMTVVVAHSVAGWRAAAVSVLVLCVSAGFIIASTQARSEAVIIPLTLLIPLCMMRFPRGLTGFAIPALVVAVMTGVRLIYLPSLVVVAALAWWHARPTRGEAAVGVLLIAAALALFYAPFLLIDADRSWFNLYSSQAWRSEQFTMIERPAGIRLTDGVAGLYDVLAYYAVAAVPAGVLCLMLIDAAREGWRPASGAMRTDARTACAVLLAVAAAIWVPYLAIFEVRETRYFVPIVALLASAIGIASAARDGGPSSERARVLQRLTLLLAGVTAVASAADAPTYLDVRSPDLEETRTVAAYLREVVPEDGYVATFHTQFAFEAERDVVPGLEMGRFGYWPFISGERATSYGVVNRDSLLAAMVDPSVRAVVIDPFDGILLAESTPARPPPPVVEQAFLQFPELAPYFEVSRVYPGYGQFDGVLYVLTRK